MESQLQHQTSDEYLEKLLTSHEEHLRLLLHGLRSPSANGLRSERRAGAHLHRFLVLVVVLDYVYCLLHIAKHEIAVTVVSLQLISLSAPGEAV